MSQIWSNLHNNKFYTRIFFVIENIKYKSSTSSLRFKMIPFLKVYNFFFKKNYELLLKKINFFLKFCFWVKTFFFVGFSIPN